VIIKEEILKMKIIQTALSEIENLIKVNNVHNENNQFNDHFELNENEFNRFKKQLEESDPENKLQSLVIQFKTEDFGKEEWYNVDQEVQTANQIHIDNIKEGKNRILYKKYIIKLTTIGG
jgi:predicted nuclease with TOPRIM domain